MVWLDMILVVYHAKSNISCLHHVHVMHETIHSMASTLHLPEAKMRKH